MIHSPHKIRIVDCKRLGIDKNMVVTGAIIGMAELYDVKRYDSSHALSKDANVHHAGVNAYRDKTFGFMLKNPKAFKKQIPHSGQLGFFEAEIPKDSLNNL